MYYGYEECQGSQQSLLSVSDKRKMLVKFVSVFFLILTYYKIYGFKILENMQAFEVSYHILDF